MAEKRRADQLLVEQGLAESRTKAQALILAGLVSCSGRRIDKPGEQLAADMALALKERDHPWVSRGGVKLAAALDHFRITVEEGAIGGFGSHVLHHLTMNGLLDHGLKIRTMVLPDVYLDHDSPQAQYDEAGHNARHIVAMALSALGREIAAQPARA